MHFLEKRQNYMAQAVCTAQQGTAEKQQQPKQQQQQQQQQKQQKQQKQQQ